MKYIEVLEALHFLCYGRQGDPVGLSQIVWRMTSDARDINKIVMHLRHCAVAPRNLVKIQKVPVPGRGSKNLYSLTPAGLARVEWARKTLP